jgi:hemolysin activation/secretion protein
MNIRRHPVFAVLICLLVTSARGAEGGGQAVKTEGEKVRKSTRNLPPDETSPAKVTLPEDTSQRLLVETVRIKGNKLVSTPELLEELPLTYVTSGTKDGETVEEVYDFRPLHETLADPGPEREVSLRTIQGFTKYLLSVYQEKGYAGIYVYVPAEAVEEGTNLKNKILPIQILEGRIAKLRIERYDFDRQQREKGFLKDSVIESWSPAKTGETIHKKKLGDFLKLLNLNPDRHISAVVSRSAEPNALNLTYDVYESNPWHSYLQVDNAGTEDRQWAPRIGVINTNLTGIDDTFSLMYQAPWEKGIEDQYAVFGSYGLPIGTPRLRLNLHAGYSEFDIPGLTGIDFLGNGSFYGSALNYTVFQKNDWFVDLVGSVSRENSKVTPSLGISSDVDMDLWGLGIRIHRSHTISDASLTFNRVESMGGSGRTEFQKARLGSDPDFVIYDLSAMYSRYLDARKAKRFRGSLRYVYPEERLVPAKMTSFGGFYSVRGYEEDEIVADGGLIISGQYEYDLLRHFESGKARQAGSTEKPSRKRRLKKLAPLVFTDYGRAKIKDPLPTEKETWELSSIGTGIIVEVGDNFAAGLYYGWALRGTDETDRGDGRLNVRLMYRF